VRRVHDHRLRSTEETLSANAAAPHWIAKSGSRYVYPHSITGVEMTLSIYSPAFVNDDMVSQ
jgi:hypothetical protein